MKLYFEHWKSDTDTRRQFEHLIHKNVVSKSLYRCRGLGRSFFDNTKSDSIYAGPWIAGGAARMMYQNCDFIELNDVDIFLRNDEECNDFKHVFASNKLIQVYGSKNSFSFRAKADSMKFQLVNQPYASIMELFDSFDITVSQIAICNNIFVYTEEFKRDIDDMRLVFRRINPKSFVARYMKYQLYGFKSPPGVFESVYQTYGNDLTMESEDGAS